jgi:hypothetical protein
LQLPRLSTQKTAVLVVALVLALVLVLVVVVVVLLLLLLRAAIPTRPSSCCAFAPSGLQTTNCIIVQVVHKLQITDDRRAQQLHQAVQLTAA